MCVLASNGLTLPCAATKSARRNVVLMYHLVDISGQSNGGLYIHLKDRNSGSLPDGL